MIHEFFYSEFSHNPNYDYTLYHGQDADVSLHDSLIQYFSDSLNWVSSFNPAMKMNSQTGLNNVGPTVVKSAGARNLHNIAKAWSYLFMQSPRQVQLTGEFGWIVGQKPEDGRYAKLNFDRDELVSNGR